MTWHSRMFPKPSKIGYGAHRKGRCSKRHRIKRKTQKGYYDSYPGSEHVRDKKNRWRAIVVAHKPHYGCEVYEKAEAHCKKMMAIKKAQIAGRREKEKWLYEE